MWFFQGWSSEAADILPTKIRFFSLFARKILPQTINGTFSSK
jgi:hypothetical protein